MTKLPINLLLYVAILGLGAADGLQFWQAYQEKDNKLDQEEIKTQLAAKLEAGKKAAGQASVGPSYDPNLGFWQSLKTANFHGEVPPEVASTGTEAGDQTPAPPVIPEVKLEEIFAVVCMVFDAGNSRVILRYKPSANVQPPAEVLADLGMAGPGSGMDTAAIRPGVPVSRAGPMPMSGDGLGAAQHLMLHDTLWKPYEHIRLVQVSEDARYAVFRIEKPSTPEAEWQQEKMYPEALQLPQEVLRQLEEGLGVAVAPSERADAEEAYAPAEPSGWQEMADTQEVSRNRYNVGTRDRDLFRSDPQRVFNEDIGTASYRSRDGRVQGVKITRLSPGYESYGVQLGEVIVAVNGEPVRSKAEGIKVGKRLYQQGVRTFEVQFLRNGQPITRTYVAPDE